LLPDELKHETRTVADNYLVKAKDQVANRVSPPDKQFSDDRERIGCPASVDFTSQRDICAINANHHALFIRTQLLARKNARSAHDHSSSFASSVGSSELGSLPAFGSVFFIVSSESGISLSGP